MNGSFFRDIGCLLRISSIFQIFRNNFLKKLRSFNKLIDFGENLCKKLKNFLLFKTVVATLNFCKN
jgi:hypothetical protein